MRFADIPIHSYFEFAGIKYLKVTHCLGQEVHGLGLKGYREFRHGTDVSLSKDLFNKIHWFLLQKNYSS